MTPIQFPEANTKFGPPVDMAESQVMSIPAFRGVVSSPSSSVDGAPQVVVAWQPTAEEVRRIVAGQPIFISFLCDGLPPHFPSLSFHEATHPA